MSDEFVFPLSSAQRRFWFLQSWDPDDPAYNVPVAFNLRGSLDSSVLERAFQTIVARHEALRTTFGIQDDRPVQIVHAASAGPIVTTRDLGDLPAAGRQTEAERLIAEEIHRPFDLTRGPLLRVLLIRLAPGEAQLLLTLHHIVSDGWGLAALMHELGACYRAARDGSDPGLPPLEIQYPDYTLWQERHERDRHDVQLAYWRDRLREPRLSLALTPDRPPPAAPTGTGTRHPFRVGADLVEAIRAVGAARGATLFMTLLAAFQVLLHRYADQDDVLVATVFAGRTESALEPLVGCFVNTLAMRGDLSGDPPFVELLQRVRAGTLEAFAHADLPFDTLVEALQPERASGRAPLCQAAFVLQQTPDAPLQLDAVQATPVPLWTRTAKFDVTLAVTPDEDGWSATLEYRTDLFEAETIARMADHYVTLLDGIVASPASRLSELTLLSPEERHRLVVEFNDTAAPYPSAQLVHERFAEQVVRDPGATAIVCDARTLSYAELDASATALADRLRRAGVARGDVVGVCLERSVEAIVVLLATLKAGAAYAPMDPRWGSERLRFVVEDSGARMLLDQAGLQTPESVAGRSVAAEAWPPGAVPSDNVAYLMYTSGSTGEPKAVAVTHCGIMRLVCGNWYAPLTSDDAVLHASPLTFDASTFEIWGALLNGGRLIVAAERQPSLEELGGLIEQGGVTAAWFTADLFQQMVASQLDRLRTVRQVLTGGDVVSPEHARALLRSQGVTLVNGYGPTENTTFTCCHRMTDPSDVGPTVSIGRPIANTTVYVLDRWRRPVPVGVPGELYTGGAGVARGYWRRPDLTTERFAPDPFATEPAARLYRTGDRVRHRPDGTLEFLGRLDRQVKLRGFRIELEEVEAVLARVPGVREAAVAVYDGGGREHRALVAYVSCSDDQTSEASIRSHLASAVPDYMVPSAFTLMDALPRTSAGKIDRRALPAFDPRRQPLSASVAPRNQVEELLVGLWRQLLRIDRVGVDDDFFALGGHSLLAMQLVSRVRSTFGRDLRVRAVFEDRTITRLAQRLSVARTAVDEIPPPAPCDRTAPLPLSFAQRRLWFLDRLESGGSSYHVDFTWRLEGPLDAGALRSALDGLAARHEVLRTVFPSIDGVPAQVVLPAEPVPVGVVDLGGELEAARESSLAKVLEREINRPFDLAHGPLLRATLVRLGESAHVLLLAMHHIICDGWSLGVMGRDLSALYAAAIDGRAPVLPPLTVQYADYSVWQRRWLEGPEHDRQLAYWTARLDGAPPSLNLATDRPRPAVRTTRGGRESLSLDEHLVRAVSAISVRHDVTPHMTLLGVFAVLLARHTGQTDIVIGSPTAGRPHVDLENLVGFFVNTLALRLTVDDDPSGATLLRRVRDVTLDAYEHSAVPFEDVVEALHARRDPSRTPVFQAMFVLQNTPAAALDLPGVRATECAPRAGTSKCDVLLVVRPAGSGWDADFEYNSDLFDAATMRRFASRFRTLLESLAADDSRPVTAWPLLPAAERQLVAIDWNDTGEPYPRSATIHGLFAQEVARRPDDVFLVQGRRKWTGRQLEARANQLARRLRAAGVGADRPVGIAGVRSPETIVAMLAVLKAGGAYMPINPSDPTARIAFVLRDAGVRVVIAEAALQEAIRHELPEILTLRPGEDVVAEDVAGLEESSTAESLAYVMYTSGSTGEPKGVCVPHRAVVRLIYGLERITGAPARRFLQLSPLSFDASTFDIWMPLLRGGRCVLFDAALPSAGELARVIREHGIECLWLTSTLFNAIVDERPDALSGAREVFIGGEAVSPVHVAKALDALPGTRIVNGYGPTEATTFTCCYPIPRPFDPTTEVPIGRPLANTRAVILDARQEVVPIGVTGELYIGGDGLARGYLNRPELTAERFVRHPLGGPDGRLYRTGDFARYRPDGTIEFVGRLDRQIKLRGFRIELDEIESVLARHPDVGQAAVEVNSSAAGDASIVAFVSFAPGSITSPEDLRSFLAGHLPPYMVPARVIGLDALPMTANGKLDRAALPRDLAPLRSEPSRAQFAGGIEPRLAAIWTEVLGTPPAGPNQNFFDAGGHSLLAVRMVARIETDCHVTLPVSALFLAPSIAALAKVIENVPPIGRPIIVPMRSEGTRPCVVFIHTLGGEVWTYVSLVRRLGQDQPCIGLQLPEFPAGQPFPTIESLAGRYVTSLMSAVPGPYVLAGYSSGATIAYEMARQLLARGGRVPLVVALDGGLPNRGPHPRGWARITGIVRNVPWWIRYDLLETPPREMLERVRVKLVHATAAVTRRLGRRAARQVPAFDIRTEQGVPLPWTVGQSSHLAAVWAYHPRPFAGRVAVLKARARPLAGPHEHDLGWSRLVTGVVSVRDISGSHETMLREPYVRMVADALRAEIDAAGE